MLKCFYGEISLASPSVAGEVNGPTGPEVKMKTVPDLNKEADPFAETSFSHEIQI